MSGPISASPFPFDPGPLGFSAFESLKREAVDIRQRGLREIGPPQTGSISERGVHLCGSPGLFGGFPFPLGRRGVFSFGLCVRGRWRGGSLRCGSWESAPAHPRAPLPRAARGLLPGGDGRHNGDALAPTAAARWWVGGGEIFRRTAGKSKAKTNEATKRLL